VDSDRISQTVINLLVNAIKFSPQAGEILLRANNKDNMLNVEIIDNGPGVPANKKESIFEKYKQTKSNRAQEKSGTGLGLAICKKIVEQHGGSIGVRPNLEAGVGSVFWFTIPSPSVLPEIEEGL
jgi:signal transduction histidine kinase